MSWTARLPVLAAAAALLAGCTASAVDTRRLTELFAEIPDDQPGCAAAVYDDDGVAWTGVRGFADKEDLLLITNETEFALGQTGQQFVATALLLLAQRGALDLDDPIRRHLPSLPAWADTVTVKHLLNRTSGIPDYGLLGADTSFYRVTGDDLLEAIGRAETLLFPPGTEFGGQWSDDVLEGFIVEAVDGRALPEILDAEVFRPAGVDATAGAVVDGQDVAVAYGNSTGPPAQSRREALRDIAIYTTASDLAKWGSQYWNPSVGGEELLERRTAHMVLWTSGPVSDEGLPHRGDAHGRYSSGVFAVGGDDPGDPDLLLSSPGEDQGFVSDLLIAPEERVAVAVLCNNGVRDASVTAKDLLVAYIAER